MNGVQPLVSIIVSCYNIEQYVGACLESIATQTYPNIEVLLVDDGSTDGTGELLARFARGRAHWRVLAQANSGLSSARNTGIEAAIGDWLIFVDGDDALAAESTEMLLSSAIESGADLVCGNHVVQSHGKNVAVWPPSDEVRLFSREQAFASVLYHREINVSAWGKIYARSLFATIRYPEGRIYEDTYVFDDVLLKADRIAYLARPLYHYIMRSGSIVNMAWSGKQLQFIDAVDKFADHAEQLYPNLARGVLRRRVHARLSVLRYLEHARGDDKRLRNDIVTYVRQQGRSVLSDSEAPARDKVGIILASISPKLFFWFWRAYSALRRDR